MTTTPETSRPKLIDGMGRTIVNLRISVTDRCNFRCTYCMPADNVEFMDRSNLLSFEEIQRVAQIVSRIGISADALPFSEDTDLFQSLIEDKDQIEIKCVLIDEAQFLTKKQVAQLGKIADELDTAVLAFGIRTDFQGELFEGSKYLLAWADNLKEIKTVCWCGRKATMVVRLDKEGNIVSQGEQLEIGGNEKYVPLCRAHFNKKKLGN